MTIDTTLSNAIPNELSNFAMVVGPELAQLISRTQSCMVKMGHFAQEIIHEMLSPYEMSVDEIDSFLGHNRGGGLQRLTSYDVGYFTWKAFTQSRFFHNVGIGEFRMGDGRKVSRPDYFVVVNSREGAYLMIIEQKIGSKFDTKSVIAERDALFTLYSMIKPHVRHVHVCPMIATTSPMSDKDITDGFKNYLPLGVIEDGVVSVVRNSTLFETLGIPYVMEDRLAKIRAENAQYFINEVQKISGN